MTETRPGRVKIAYEGRESTIPIKELTWEWGERPTYELVQVGQKIRVKVLHAEEGQLTVSLREAVLGGNPWDTSPNVGDEYFAPVSRTYGGGGGYRFYLDYHCKALMKEEDAPMRYQTGDRVKVRVISVDRERRIVEITPAGVAGDEV